MEGRGRGEKLRNREGKEIGKGERVEGGEREK